MDKISGDSNHFVNCTPRVVRKVWVVVSVMVSESGSEGWLVSLVWSDESSIAIGQISAGSTLQDFWSGFYLCKKALGDNQTGHSHSSWGGTTEIYR